MKTARESLEECVKNESSSVAERSASAVELMKTLMQTTSESVNFLAMQTPSGD